MTGRGTAFTMQHVMGVPRALVRRGLLGRDLFMTRTLCSPGPSQPREKRPEEVAPGLFHRLTALGRALGHDIRQRASSTATTWWDRYEEFVGLNEVREAQGNVTEVRREVGVVGPAFWLGNCGLEAPARYSPATWCWEAMPRFFFS